MASRSKPARRGAIRRIGISTGGGDAPGLNAVIRAVALCAHRHGWEAVGMGTATTASSCRSSTRTAG